MTKAFYENLAVRTLDLKADIKENGTTWKEAMYPIRAKLETGLQVSLNTSNGNIAHSTSERFKVDLGKIDELVSLLSDNSIIWLPNRKTVVVVNGTRFATYMGSRKGRITEALSAFQKAYKAEAELLKAEVEREAIIAAETLEKAEREELEKLLAQQNRIKELGEKYGTH